MGSQSNKPARYDLTERTAIFGESIIDLAKHSPNTIITRPLLLQLIRSSTSIGANYREADAAESKKDFVHKTSISMKEAKETCYWLRLLKKANSAFDFKIDSLSQEAHELVLIFATIVRRSKMLNR